MNRYDLQGNFIPADYEPPPVQPAADLVRSDDVTAAVQGLIATYGEQQRRVLAGQVLPPEQAAGGARGHGYSSAGELAERRKTSGMYLVQQSGAVALTVGGITLIAWLAGAASGGQAFAAWVAATGALSLLLSYRQHRQEQKLSPEGIELERLAWVGSLAEYDAETRREVMIGELGLRRMAMQAESERQQAARLERAAEVARLQTQLERRQPQRRPPIEEPEPPAWLPASPTVAATAPPLPADCGQTAAPLPAAEPVAHDTWLERRVLAEVAALYDTDPDGRLVRVNRQDGRIEQRLSWSTRGDLPKLDAERVAAALSAISPPLIEQRAGGRYYLDLRAYPARRMAVRAVQAAWDSTAAGY